MSHQASAAAYFWPSGGVAGWVGQRVCSWSGEFMGFIQVNGSAGGSPRERGNRNVPLTTPLSRSLDMESSHSACAFNAKIRIAQPWPVGLLLLRPSSTCGLCKQRPGRGGHTDPIRFPKACGALISPI